jgi:hypothetical protein
MIILKTKIIEQKLFILELKYFKFQKK